MERTCEKEGGGDRFPKCNRLRQKFTNGDEEEGKKDPSKERRGDEDGGFAHPGDQAKSRPEDCDDKWLTECSKGQRGKRDAELVRGEVAIEIIDDLFRSAGAFGLSGELGFDLARPDFNNGHLCGNEEGVDEKEK